MAETFGTRPSDLLGLPPSALYESFCVDEALSLRLNRWKAKQLDPGREERSEGDDGERDLYREIKADPRTGKPPPAEELAKIAEAQALIAQAGGGA